MSLPESLIDKIFLFNIHPVAEIIKNSMRQYCYDGYDESGFNIFGFNEWGYDRKGYGKGGYDRYGYDKYGYDRDGECENCVRHRSVCRCD